MVSKINFPRFYFVMSVSFVFVILCLQCVLSTNVQYCWKGSEEDHTNFRNISCANRQTYIPNTISLQNSSSTAAPVDDSAVSGGYYCMVITVYEENESDNITSQTLTAEYDCDTNNLCLEKNMKQDYKLTCNGKTGYIHCCDTENNCNTPQLLHQKKVEQRCYNGDLSTKTAHIETCAQNSLCVRIRKKDVNPDTFVIETVDEEFFCDTENMCEAHGLHEVGGQSCIEYNSYGGGALTAQETEECCCKDELCFIPTWLQEEANTDTVMTRPNTQNTWQQTLLIIIGIALGIIFISAAVFFVIRTVRNKDKGDIPRTQYNTTAYRHVHSSSSTRDDDTVQILPDSEV